MEQVEMNEEVLTALRETGLQVLNDRKENELITQIDGDISWVEGDIRNVYSMLKDYMRRNYNYVPLGTITAIVGALVYRVWSKDLINDEIPKLGMLDDTAVFMIAMCSIKNDLNEYVEWRKKQDSNLNSALDNLNKVGDSV